MTAVLAAAARWPRAAEAAAVDWLADCLNAVDPPCGCHAAGDSGPVAP